MKKKLLLTLAVILSFHTIFTFAFEDIGVAQSEALGKFMEISAKWDNSGNSSQYPDYYGGSYINNNNELVIYITDDTENIPSFLNDDDIILQSVPYSYNELYNMVSDLTDKVWENPVYDLPFTVYCIYLSDIENKVVVEMDSLTQQNVDIFRNKICDSPMIIFKEGTPIRVDM